MAEGSFENLGPRWYVAHTYTGYENKVMANLEKIIENRSLQHLIFDIKVPVETVVEIVNGQEKQVENKIFPGYVFVKMVYSNNVWFLVTSTRGVTGFVGPQGRPLPLTDDEVRRMQLEKVAVDVDFAIGDDVRICSGPLDTFMGTITELNPTSQKAKVTVTMFGRTTDVELDFTQLQKLNIN